MVTVPLVLVAVILSASVSAGNFDGPVELPNKAFHTMIVFLFFLLLFLLFAPHDQGVISQRDVDILGIDAGQVGFDEDLLVGLFNVTVRLPGLGHSPIGFRYRSAKEPLHQFVDVVAKTLQHVLRTASPRDKSSHISSPKQLFPGRSLAKLQS